MPDVPFRLWLLLASSVAIFGVCLTTLLWASRAARELERLFGESDQEEPPCGSAS